ncbi:DUF4062 domain-containing protein [Sorangium sp. So ce854]|uniref:DUF4062 domain-containing protein n=1 Tax=Sorangium sp. So ce854 TaxID=3133322 RepID=UPI003F5DB794
MSVFRTDKIRVFVSSTIRECAEEREVAKRAILSLNHIPIMFEDVGARAQAPRDVYLRGIEEAQIFVAIYKDSRGWIAGDMEVSGIEDEYRHASHRGMPRLVYMKEASGKPPPWLGALADVMVRDQVSVHFFKDGAGLYERIRDDVESVIAGVLYAKASMELLKPSTPREVLDSLVPDLSKRIRRPEIEQKVLRRVAERHAVLITGPMGIGKTVLTAQLADEHGYVYLPAGGLSTKEIAATCAQLLRERAGLEIPRYIDLDAAAGSFVRAWQDTDGFTLAIDGCAEPERILDLAVRAGGVSESKRLLMSSVTAPETLAPMSVGVPPLTRGEVQKLVNLQSSQVLSAAGIAELTERSQGNPLYLRYATSGDADLSLRDMEEYEKEHWLRLKPKAKELVTYVALADRTLPLGVLGRLLGVDSIEEIDTFLGSARHLLREERGGYTVVHDHLRQTVRALLSGNAPKHSYYANQLAKQLVADEDYVGAFLVLNRAGDPKAARLARRAAFEAQIGGDVKASLQIMESRVAYASEVGDLDEQILAELALAQAKFLGGDKDGAKRSLSAAGALVSSVADDDLRFMFEEQEIMLALRIEPTQRDIDRLKAIEQRHLERGNPSAAARVGVDLSEILIRLAHYKEAAAESERALAWFEAAKDDYGASVARANLAAALGAIPGEEARSAALFKRIRNSIDEEANIRGKAWVRNMLAIKLRHAARYPEARQYAEEAIALGEHLGDQYVVGVNRIALGNVLRDTENLDEALVQYERAAQLAQQAAFRDIEATANELVASVLNQRGEYTKSEHYARVAAGLVRETAADHTFAKAMEELAVSLLHRENPEGIWAYLEGASAIAHNANYVDYFYKLGLEGLFSLPDSEFTDDYFGYIDRLFALEAPVTDDRAEAFCLRVPALLEKLNRSYVVIVTGAHFGRLFRGVSLPVARFLLRRLISMVLTPRRGATLPVERLLALIPLIASVPMGTWKPSDIIALGERLFSQIPSISFKPRPDGSVHWVVRLDLAVPVTCSVQQVDDGTDSALVATLFVLFLKGFQDEIQRQVVLASSLSRREIAVDVMGVATFREHVTKDPQFRLPDGDAPCVVSRPTNPKDPQRVPTVVVCRDDISRHWHAGQRRGSAIQVLFGLTLVEIVWQLFEGQIDMEVLRPRIVSVVQKSIS